MMSEIKPQKSDNRETMPDLLVQILSDTDDNGDLRKADYFKRVPVPEVRGRGDGVFCVPCLCEPFRSRAAFFDPSPEPPPVSTIGNQAIRLVPQRIITPKRYFDIWVGMCPICLTLYWSWEARPIDEYILKMQEWEQKQRNKDRAIANAARSLVREVQQ